MPLLVKPKEGHFDVKEDPGRVTDTETSVGICGASRTGKGIVPRRGYFIPLCRHSACLVYFLPQVGVSWKESPLLMRSRTSLPIL